MEGIVMLNLSELKIFKRFIDDNYFVA
jgi:hypothetical protein